jgi:hypothetical protein
MEAAPAITPERLRNHREIDAEATDLSAGDSSPRESRGLSAESLDLGEYSPKPIATLQIAEPADVADECFNSFVNQLRQKLEKDDDPNLPYTPYLRAVRSKTRGYAQRVPGSLSNRLHDFLSRHEFHVFLLFDWDNEQYRNIREQFPISSQLTSAVAAKNNLLHPYFLHEPATLSVDWMLSLKSGGWRAVDFKEKVDRAKPKTLTKLRIVELALAEAGVPHAVMTEDDIPRTVIRNYRFLRILSLPFDPPPLASAEMAAIAPPLRELLETGQVPVFDAALKVAEYTKISAARISRAAFWLIANRSWPVNFHQPIGPDYPVHFNK